MQLRAVWLGDVDHGEVDVPGDGNGLPEGELRRAAGLGGPAGADGLDPLDLHLAPCRVQGRLNAVIDGLRPARRVVRVRVPVIFDRVVLLEVGDTAVVGVERPDGMNAPDPAHRDVPAVHEGVVGVEHLLEGVNLVPRRERTLAGVDEGPALEHGVGLGRALAVSRGVVHRELHASLVGEALEPVLLDFVVVVRVRLPRLGIEHGPADEAVDVRAAVGVELEHPRLVVVGYPVLVGVQREGGVHRVRGTVVYLAELCGFDEVRLLGEGLALGVDPRPAHEHGAGLGGGAVLLRELVRDGVLLGDEQQGQLLAGETLLLLLDLLLGVRHVLDRVLPARPQLETALR